MVSRRKKFLVKLRDKYKLVILNDDTFEEKGSFTLTRLNVYIFGSAILIILVSLVTAILVLTPLKEYIPGYADVSMRRDLTNMMLRTDSLEKLMEAGDIYLNNINNIISGRVGVETPGPQKKPALLDSINLRFERSEEDSLLRKMIESQDQYELSADTRSATRTSISGYSFFTPLKGIVTEKYEASSGHYGIDVAAKKNETIKAALDGTVILANWTSETGYVIALQHANNLISIYKHNSVLLKKVGSFVSAGEVIAIVGNSGEYTSGPHLHFELWHNGNPVDPSAYINF